MRKMAEIIENRYNRQELISGWKQEKISKASVAIVGSDALAGFTSASLAALGFGEVTIYDNARFTKADPTEFLLKLSEVTGSKVEALEDILGKMNPMVNVIGVHAKMDSPAMAELLWKPKLIIEATNSPASKKVVYEYADKRKIPVISASADLNWGEIYVRQPGDNGGNMDAYEGKPQGAVPAEVLAGFIADEARKIIMPLGDGDEPIKQFTYSCASPKRFSRDKEVEIGTDNFSGKRVLMIGAGALGNFVGLGLAIAGVGKVDMLDFDNVEVTNLARQILFYDAVGQNKAKALAAKLKLINPKCKAKGINGKLDENYTEYFEKNQLDLIIDCVDNQATRAFSNFFAVKYKVPLISGGTSPFKGQVMVYKPGESSCLDCRYQVDAALGKERVSHSCTHAVEASVIMSNEIIGGLMVAEARSIMSPEQYGSPIKKMIMYDSRSAVRAGLVGGETSCDCTRGDIKEWMGEVLGKAKEKKAE